MNDRDVKGAFIIILLVVYTILFRNFIVGNYSNMYYAITSSVMIFIVFLCYLFFGYQKFKFNSIRKRVLILVFISMILYFTFIYVMGIFTGFEKSSYDLSLTGIINNIFGLILYVISEELLRYMFISANKDKKYMVVLITIILSLIEFNLAFELKGDFSTKTLFYLITNTVVPIITKNILLSYLSYNLGYVPTIAYNVIMSIYIFIIPTVPIISDYIMSLLGLVVPFIIYTFTSRMLTEYYDPSTPEFSHRVFNIIDIPVGIIVIVLMFFISGVFRYFLIGVASESMTPYINKGDSVLIDKKVTVSELKIGDIIAYQNGDKVIIHRIVSIKPNEEGIMVVDTKGDANNIADGVELTDDLIIGKMIYKIPYIAIPTVWFRERFG